MGLNNRRVIILRNISSLFREESTCFLPKNPGMISRFMLRHFFAGIQISPNAKTVIRGLPENAVIVYIGKYKSNFEYLCCHTIYQAEGIPSPQIGFDYAIKVWQPLSRLLTAFLYSAAYCLRHLRFPSPYQSGYFERKLISGNAGFLSLVERRDFYQRFVRAKTDPLRHLIELQQKTTRPIVLIPNLMFFGKKPPTMEPSLVDLFLGPEQRPGRLRKLLRLLRKPGGIFIELSDPVNLQDFLQTGAAARRSLGYGSLLLRRDLLSRLNRHRKSVTGPLLKSPDELKQEILTGDRLQSFMVTYAKRRKKRIDQIRREALGYLDEIAAKYSPAFIRVGVGIVRRFLTLMFEDIDFNADALEQVRRMSRKGPLILVPCHKSHMDSIVLSYLLYTQNMACPHIFAGKNLSFWPMGPIIRRSGAFFVRRTFAGAVFYSKVFTEYIFKILEEGFNIAFYIEGTRSRTGKMFRPQLGMLSLLLGAVKNGAGEDLAFVPIYIGYDSIPEAGAYVNEIESGKKEPESFRQLMKARKILQHRYGRIYVRFNTPLSMKTLLAESNQVIDRMTSKEINLFCRALGSRVVSAVSRSMVVTSQAVVAAGFLNTPKEIVSADDLLFRVEIYLSHLHQQGVEMTGNLMEDPAEAIRQAIDYFCGKKYIQKITGKNNLKTNYITYRVNPARRIALDYYKNNAIGPFVPAAFTALVILDKDAFQFSASDLHNGYQFLQDLLENEFARDVDKPEPFIVRKTIKTFIDEAILVPHQTLPDTYNLTSAGFRKLAAFAAFSKPFLEAYKVVLNYFKNYPKGYHDKKRRFKKVESLGNRMFKRKEIELMEALSGITYTNAIDRLPAIGIRGSENAGAIENVVETIDRYLKRMS